MKALSRLRVPPLALCVALATIACDRHPEPAPAASSASRTTALTPRLLEPGALRAALGQVLAQAGPSPQVLELSMRPDRIILQARDRKQPTRVLQHEVRGDGLLPPTPVRLEGSGALEDNLFPLSDVALDALPEMMAQAVESVDPEHGKVTHILLRRNLPHSMDVQFRVYVSSPTKDGIWDADQYGKPTSR